MENKKNVLKKLFFSTLYLSAFTFGGGYVIVTLMQKKFVDQYHWIDKDEMLDLVAIAQSAPGAIAVNGAIVVGYKLAGFIGAVVAIIATILPPFVVISMISFIYAIIRDNIIVSQMLEGMQAGVGAVIMAVVYEMARGIHYGKHPASAVICIGALVVCLCGVSVIYVVIACIIIGLIRTCVFGRKESKEK